MLIGMCESDDVFIEFSENGSQKIELKPRKRDNRVFVKTKQLIMMIKLQC
jgi:hypothetical protein